VEKIKKRFNGVTGPFLRNYFYCLTGIFSRKLNVVEKYSTGIILVTM
jgi:hypothetical protein